MLRHLILITSILTVFTLPAESAIWPEAFFGFSRTSVTPVTQPDEAIWEEYGFEEAEIAEYSGEEGDFKATAQRFADSTSAMSVFQWRRPAGYTPSNMEVFAAESPDSLYFLHGNYILHFEGRKPTAEELEILYLVLPLTDQSALPTLPNYLPPAGRIYGSERFIIGPVSLKEFEPRISPSVAGFHFSAEAQLAKYSTSNGEMDLAIFSYPTPHIARERLAEFRMIPGALAKRAGPMVAIIIDAPDDNNAQELLGKINYRATITWDQVEPVTAESIADMLLAIFALVGVLLVFAIAAGLLFGGSRTLWFRRTGSDPDPMILLHLEDK